MFQFEKVVCTKLLMGLNCKSQGNSIKQWILFILWTSMKPIDNSQIPCGESVKLLTFLGHFFCNSCDWPKCFITKKDPFKMELKYISSRKRPFCWFIHSLCKNQNIPMRESALPHIQRECLPIIALNFSYYEFFISIHSWLMLAMIAKNRKLGFLLTRKQKSPELIRVQMTSFSFREWISTDIHTIAWASFPEWILLKNHPRSECIVF